MKKVIIFLVVITMYACGGSDDDPIQPPTSNDPPSVPVLITPENGLLCSENPLDFSWSASTDPDNDVVSYQIQVATNEQFTSNVQTKTAAQSNSTFDLIKGQEYYWRVRARDAKNNYSEYAPTWKFYSEGDGVSNHLPYTPSLISPLLNADIAEVSTSLEWSASDVDNDPLTFDVYFGKSNPPALIAENISETTYSTNLDADTIYYWNIVVKDTNGGQSVGQIWSFNSK